MAAIIQDKKQEQALEDIEKALDTIRRINLMRSGWAHGSGAQVVMVPAMGRSIKLGIEAQDQKSLDAMCAKYRARSIATVRRLAAKYRIDLDDDDLACMEDEIQPGAGEGGRESQEGLEGDREDEDQEGPDQVGGEA